VGDPTTRREGEKRARTRFALELQLDCKTKKLHTPGKTVNISSTGVLFNAQNELTLGPGIDLVLDWPVLLEGYTALRLHLRGSIVRASGRQAAFEIVQVYVPDDEATADRILVGQIFRTFASDRP